MVSTPSVLSGEGKVQLRHFGLALAAQEGGDVVLILIQGHLAGRGEARGRLNPVLAGGIKTERPSACVARNAKRLSGLKLLSYARDGRLSITEKAQQLLFLRRCIMGLLAVATDPLTKLESDVAYFLGKKAHIVARADGEGHDISDKGRDSLADIDTLGL